MKMERFALICLAASSCCNVIQADVTFFTDESAWQAAVGGTTEAFVFTATNVALADEIVAPPAVGSLVGQNLTFQSAVTLTPFSFGFMNTSPDAGTEILFAANGLGSGPSNHHDWTFTAGPANAPTAIGIEIFAGGAGSLIDAISVFDVNGTQLDSLTTLGIQGGDTFIGITSDYPIGSILYDDNPISGGQVLKRLVTVPIPEPSATTLILATAPILTILRRRRSQHYK